MSPLTTTMGEPVGAVAGFVTGRSTSRRFVRCRAQQRIYGFSLFFAKAGQPELVTITGCPKVADGYLFVAQPYLAGLNLRRAFPCKAARAGIVHELVELVMVNGTVK